MYKFDGSPQIPMYLVYNPPQMLPTQTLNPTTSATAGAASTAKSRVKRSMEETTGEKAEAIPKNQILTPTERYFNPDKWWWVGVGLTAVGTVMYMMPTSV